MPDKTDATVIEGFQAEPNVDFSADAEDAAESVDNNGRLVRVNPWANMSIAEMAQHFGDRATDAAEMGDGFATLNKDEKSVLVGIPFLMLDYIKYNGDQGPYVSIRVATLDGTKRYRVNDGSTGIFADLEAEHLKRHGKPLGFKELHEIGMVCRHGLRDSTYKKALPGGREVDGRTFYLDSSA